MVSGPAYPAQNECTLMHAIGPAVPTRRWVPSSGVPAREDPELVSGDFFLLVVWMDGWI